MSHLPLHHIVRIRSSSDLSYVRPGLMDEVFVNANQLENSPDSTATHLRTTALPFAIDPVLWRFQATAWWRSQKGITKKNYARLGAAYVKGTAIQIAAGPLLQMVTSDGDWRAIAANVIHYQRSRLASRLAQLDILDDTQLRDLHPARLVAPALVAYSPIEDRINRLLAGAAAGAAGAPLTLPVIVPRERLFDPRELDRLLDSIPAEGINAYFVWTPNVSEHLLLENHKAFSSLLHLISSLCDRGIPVGHLHGTYSIAALHDLGVSAIAHTLGWVDKGEPASVGGGLRSCQTYVPGARHSLHFDEARTFGRHLGVAEYFELYCECDLCAGSFAAGLHPLDLLLEDQVARFKNARDRETPTCRAAGLNTWHHLLARRLEVQAFSEHAAVDVILRDLDRAAALTGGRDTRGLRRLASELRTA